MYKHNNLCDFLLKSAYVRKPFIHYSIQFAPAVVGPTGPAQRKPVVQHSNHLGPMTGKRFDELNHQYKVIVSGLNF